VIYLIGYILFAILIFGVLIFVHELGHFLAAKASGVRVNEFAICMGPAIFQKQRGETTYSLRCVPIGGYCAMEGEDEESEDPRAFSSAARWKRLLILIAGSAMNFLAGFLILLVILGSADARSTAKISGFFEGSTVSAETGLREGDEIYRIDGRRVYIYSDVSMLLARNQTGQVALEVIRDGKRLDLGTVPFAPREYELDGERVVRYGLYFAAEKTTFASVLRDSWNTCVDFARLVWLSLGDLFRRMVSIRDMSGPVGIVSVMAQTGAASETVGAGLLNISYFAAFLAVNLAVMNMLPFPALDGGRVFFLLVFTAIEKLTKKRIDPKYEGYIHAAGMILLLAFIAFITLKDIFRIFG